MSNVPSQFSTSKAIKLQVNEGQGGCFPCHFDSDEALDGRRVTAIFYLNPRCQPNPSRLCALVKRCAHSPSDPPASSIILFCLSNHYVLYSWKQGEGGELRLYPFPRRPPVDITPIADRLVLFASTRMLHRVLPSTAANRSCFTIWMSQSGRRCVSKLIEASFLYHL